MRHHSHIMFKNLNNYTWKTLEFSNYRDHTWFTSSIRIRWTSLSTTVWASNRAVAMAPTSSIKIIAGAFTLAWRNIARTILGPFCVKAATIVYQHFCIWNFNSSKRKSERKFFHYSTASRISCFWISRPPMSWLNNWQKNDKNLTKASGPKKERNK